MTDALAPFDPPAIFSEVLAERPAPTREALRLAPGIDPISAMLDAYELARAIGADRRFAIAAALEALKRVGPAGNAHTDRTNQKFKRRFDKALDDILAAEKGRNAA